MTVRRFPKGGAATPPGRSTATDHEGVPGDVVAGVKEAFGHFVPGEVAVLTYDSLVDGRAPAANHLLCFDHPVLRLDVHVSVKPDWSRLEARVHPPASLRVELERDRSGRSLVEEAPDGEFSFEEVAHGVIRLHLIGAPRRTPIRSDWFRV